MSDRPESALELTDIAEFHQQLLRLNAAGLRLQLDDRSVTRSRTSDRSLAERLNEIMASLATRAGSSATLTEVVSQADFIPERYRLALTTWYKCDRSVEALAVLRAPVQLASQRQNDLRYALLLPTIILMLIYCASFYLLLVTVPRMEAIYAQLNSPPSQAVSWLIVVRAAMPYWVPGLPLLLALAWFMLISGRLAFPDWLLSRWQSSKYLASSLLARNLSTQMDQADGGQTNGPKPYELSGPPMLRWALATDTDSEESLPESEAMHATAQRQSRRLRLAANLYESMQTIHGQRLRTGLALLGCIVLGGGLTLVYALALFAPMIQLLKDIVGT